MNYEQRFFLTLKHPCDVASESGLPEEPESWLNVMWFKSETQSSCTDPKHFLYLIDEMHISIGRR